MLVLRSMPLRCVRERAFMAAQSGDAAGRPPAATQRAAKLVYTPADFARFAPKTAYDMLVQVPGFTIKSPSPDELERGLGQATENVLINGQRIANKSGGAVDQLKRTSAASVERIEIVDAASLGIAGPVGPGREHRPEGAGKVVRPVRMGPELSRPLREARVSRGLDQLFGQERPGRLYLLGAEQLGPRRRSAGRSRSTTATASSPRAATRFIIPNMRRRTSRRSSGSTAPARRSAT